MTGYVLEAGSPAALRGNGRQRQRQQLQKGSAAKQGMLKVALCAGTPDGALLSCPVLSLYSCTVLGLFSSHMRPSAACLSIPVLAGTTTLPQLCSARHAKQAVPAHRTGHSSDCPTSLQTGIRQLGIVLADSSPSHNCVHSPHSVTDRICPTPQAGWGDADADAAPLNRHYDPELYADCGAGTRRNLARVDETRIDLDLLEVVVEHIDAAHPDGAVLVFLPGDCVETAAWRAQRSHLT